MLANLLSVEIKNRRPSDFANCPEEVGDVFSERRADFVSPACDLCCQPSDPAALSTTGQGRCDPHAEDGENQA